MFAHFLMSFTILFSQIRKFPVLVDEEENMQKDRHSQHQVNYIQISQIKGT
jgi:hypothetical protein